MKIDLAKEIRRIRTTNIIVISVLIVFLILFIGGFKYIDETALYYYFSTIAQTVGALLGVVGAFSIFKIQKIEQDILGMIEQFWDNLSEAKTAMIPNADTIVLRDLYTLIRDDVIKENTKEIIDKTNKAFTHLQDEKPALKKSFMVLQNTYYYKQNIKKSLLDATISGMSLIFISIVLILFSKPLANLFLIKFIFLLLSLVLLAITLGFFYILIQNLIKE